MENSSRAKRVPILLYRKLTFSFRFLIIFCSVFLTPYYAKAQVASDINGLLSSEGKVLFGQEPNSVLVIDYPENIKRVEEYLQMVDISPRQVLIEARVVEVKLQGEHALGINWSAFANRGGFEMGQFRIGGTTANSALQQQIPYKPTFYPPGGALGQETPFTVTIFDEDLNVVLQTLSNSIDTDILSAPKVTTVNNREAEIKIIQKLPWAEPEVTVSSESGSVTITWKINFEEVGIILKVTPMITEDGEISMELAPEVSEKISDYSLEVIQGTTKVPYTVPIIDTRTANTKVVIGDRQTLIIGGLIKERNTQGVTKIPLLGDIPGIGWLFKSKRDTKDKTELLIFVSPSIVTSSLVARMGKEERLSKDKSYIREGNESKGKELFKQEAKKERLASKVTLLEEEVKELISERQALEKEIYKKK